MPDDDVIFRPVVDTDFDDVLALYQELVGTIPVPEGDEGRARFHDILTHPGTQVWGAEHCGRIVSVATLHLLPNMTYGGRPYCLVENVVTLRSVQGRGFGAGVMHALMDAAWRAGAYKIMLLTGKALGAKGFYEGLGFSDADKFGMMIRRAPARQPVETDATRIGARSRHGRD